MNDKRLTLNGINIPHAILIFMAIGAFSTSFFLTNHFFEVRFPEGLEPSSLCQINSFFQCDSATFSVLSNIFGIPLAFLGVIFSSFIILGSLFASEEFEQTNCFLAIVNAVGCLLLFLFSLFVLKSICPFCFLYYIFSWAILGLFWKYGSLHFVPSWPHLGGAAIVFVIGGFFFHQNFQSKTLRMSQLSSSVVEEFKKLQKLPEPPESAYRVYSATAKFADAPIQITIFSDFQCPACKAFADLLPEMIRLYGTKINIQYYPYPLDDHCNPNMQTPMHAFACQAAKIAMCAPEKFNTTHETLYANQEKIGEAYLKELAQDLKVEQCASGEEINAKILDGIKIAQSFNLSSTPTLIINGRKIEGSRPMPIMSAIFDYLLSGTP